MNRIILYDFTNIREYINILGVGFSATVHLLNASTLVAVSGAFRLFIASLFLGSEASFLTYIAGGLVIYNIHPGQNT
ncbi:MAG: hypothetical protein M5U10_10085 [Candidatus Methanoperedens sp.]|uniref:hypothetical protein n=1 Tax=Candidatus Methanoperedens nitratireducens TaxID=1392998 RepID=UPI0012FF3C1C|nr:hypothetical protein [Candidatus Methanoperedens nitroreducens]MDJ1422251.1 hypothetical protein [Candidatus Methanoperedens sp.]